MPPSVTPGPDGPQIILSTVTLSAEIEDEVLQQVVSLYPYHPADTWIPMVSKRVQRCVEPLLYRTLKFYGTTRGFIDPLSKKELIHEDKFRVALKYKTQTFLHESVNNVLLTGMESDQFADELLSLCTGIQHLAVGFYNIKLPLIRRIAVLPFLSIEIDESMLGMLAEEKIELPYVTYICLNGDLSFHQDEGVIQPGSFQWLPSVTHVEILVGKHYEFFSRNLHMLLKTIARLQCIIVVLTEIWRWGEEDGVPALIDEWIELDDRIEVVEEPASYMTTWEERINTGQIRHRPYKGQR